MTEHNPQRRPLADLVRLHRSGQLEAAAAGYREILRQNPADADARHLLGLIALQRQEFAAAVELISLAIGLKPGAAPFYHNRAAALRALGRFQEAEADYLKAIALAPDYAEAYFNYSAVRRFTKQTSLHEAIERQLESGRPSEVDRCFLHFAAGKMLDDLGEYDRAFPHFASGNANRGARFDRQGHQAYYDALIETFTPQLFDKQRDVGHPSPTPVFVVGAPRSGTTLVEQIIASHPQAHGAGELGDIPSIVASLPQHAGGAPFPQAAASLEARVLRGFGQAYAERIQSLAPEAIRVVDKLPRNFEHLGLIRLLLPKAKLIYCRRDALDTCLSCYFQRFRSGQEWSYDLQDLGFFYSQQERLMDHWRRLLPGQILELDYETLVRDPAGVTRMLLTWCELEWSDQCLEFYRDTRAVATASNWQVRRPIYHDSIGRWRRYERWLAPLKEALASSKVPPLPNRRRAP